MRDASAGPLLETVKREHQKDECSAFRKHFVPRVPSLWINRVFIVGSDYELLLMLLHRHLRGIFISLSF